LKTRDLLKIEDQIGRSKGEQFRSKNIPEKISTTAKPRIKIKDSDLGLGLGSVVLGNDSLQTRTMPKQHPDNIKTMPRQCQENAKKMPKQCQNNNTITPPTKYKTYLVDL